MSCKDFVRGLKYSYDQRVFCTANIKMYGKETAWWLYTKWSSQIRVMCNTSGLVVPDLYMQWTHVNATELGIFAKKAFGKHKHAFWNFPFLLIHTVPSCIIWKVIQFRNLTKLDGLGNRKKTTVGFRCIDQVITLHAQKLALTSSTFGRRSASVVRVRTKSHGLDLLFIPHKIWNTSVMKP